MVLITYLKVLPVGLIVKKETQYNAQQLDGWLI